MEKQMSILLKTNSTCPNIEMATMLRNIAGRIENGTLEESNILFGDGEFSFAPISEKESV